MDKTQKLKNALDFSKKNPNDPRSLELRKQIETGAFDVELTSLGYDLLKVRGTAAPVAKPKETMFQEFAGTGERVAERFRERGQQFKTSFQENQAGRQTPFETGAQFASTALGTVGDVGMEAVKMLTPEWIENVLAAAPKAIAQNPNIARSLQEIQTIAKENPRLARNLGALTNIISAVPLGKGAQVGGKAALEATETGAQFAKEGAQVGIQKGKEFATGAAVKLGEKGEMASDWLNAGLNKINPQKRREFRVQQGVPEEQWLRERGIVSTPQKTVEELSTRFQAMRNNVDEALERIPGQYRDARITTVADEAAEFARSTESGAAGRMAQLAEKAKGTGLSTAQINEVKRFYERFIKTGYKKDPTKTSELVQRATNRDSGIREALLEIADKNGFPNLREISKEIQGSKFLADEIAGKMEGQAANNNLTLTDWIVLTPAVVDPTFISGFVGKKLLTAGPIRAFAARALAGFPSVKPIPKADLVAINKRAGEFLQRQADLKVETEKAGILADELQKAGFMMSGGAKGFITENPIPLTRNEQALIRAAKNRAEQQQIVQYILEQRAEGKAVGEGFTIQDIDNTPILNPRVRFDENAMRPDIQL